MARGSRKSEQLRQRLMKEGVTADHIEHHNKAQQGLDKAVRHKDKLLDYDKTRFV